MATPTEQILPSKFFMDVDRSNAIPLYFQISSRIESAIQSGALPPGTRLENEIALGERLGLSRPTVRRAIQELVDKGLLVRRRGIGTQVVQGRLSRKVELTSLHDDLTSLKKQPTTELLLHELIRPDARVARALSVATNDTVLHLKRLRFSDGVPLGVLENHLPPGFANITPEDLESHGLYQILRARGVTMRVAHQRIGARAASAEESKLLEIPNRGAVLTMDRTAFNNSGLPIEFGRHCYRPDLYSFETTLVDK
ncbi:GntR family transcriptional regulator IolR [Rhodoglobus aureus]|uniref:GntR family transcriptional regulator IolR n=2 Tax=Rhodoglobus aureus TaxID=191497 RepID=A0ABP4GC35_9MICO